MIKHVYRSILRLVALEMIVEEFSAPDGLAASTLKVSSDFGHGIPHDQLANLLLSVDAADYGTVHRESPKGLPAPTEKALRPSKGQRDPWTTEQWRQEIFRFALQHENRFNSNEYQAVYDPSQHAGLTQGRSRLGGTLFAIKERGELKRVAAGLYQLTKKGLQSASTSNQAVLFGSGTVPKEAKPEPNLTQTIIDFAKQHNGRFVSKDFAPTFNELFPGRASGMNSVYATIARHVGMGIFKKVGDGVYDLTPKEPKQPVASDKQSTKHGIATADHVLQHMQSHGGKFTSSEYRPFFEKQFQADYDKKSGTVFGAIRKLLNEGQIRKTGTGQYELVPGKSGAAHA